MIASQKISKSFIGALNYNLKKMYEPDPKKRAELLDTNFASMDIKLIREEIKLVRSLKPNLSRYVYHTSLNFSKEEAGSLSNEKLLVNRITFDGTVVSDSNNFKKSEVILRKLEERYSLIAVQPSSHAAQKAPKMGELEQIVRTGKASDKMVLQELMKGILKQKTSL